MKKINFSQHILPHIIAVAAFLLITIFFFSPVFFDNKTLEQHDIQQFQGSAKAITDYRNATGEEALWTNAMFSGMPAYLISVQWGNQAISYLKVALAVGLPHPYANVFLAFLCYYILLLSFKVRPYLAIAGAIAFGLSTYMIIGLTAGHNSRIGAIAFLPLVMAGIHLTFTRNVLLGFGITTAGMALQLRENHLQITYYLALIIVAYGIVMLVIAWRDKQLVAFAKKAGLLVVAVIIGSSSFFGQLWAISDYTKYTIRGQSELVKPGAEERTGLTKEYAFAYNYGILEPMTLLIPQFYGGTSANYFVQNEESNSYQALVQSNNNQLANQLAVYTSAYWGPQAATAGPYYAGAIVIFLFVLGIIFAPKQYVWWLVPLSMLSLMLSWGDSFKTFNYFVFDYLPGYNRFRSVNFALVIILFAMPLLGLIGLEKALAEGMTKDNKRRALIAFGIVGGLCLFLLLFGGALLDFTRTIEEELPNWFLNALTEDRKSLLRADAFRSFAFITAVFALIYFNVEKKISAAAFYALLAIFMLADLAVVNKRYLTDENFKRKRESQFFTMTEADQEILRDKSYYRVYNHDNPFAEARTSYYHQSAGGYHGAKLRRYQDFYDSCLSIQHRQLIMDAQQGAVGFEKYSAFNMLNIRYFVYGPQRQNILLNPSANGPAWFVSEIAEVQTPNEELAQTCGIDTRETAVIDVSKFNIKTPVQQDSSASINLVEHQPNYLKYQAETGAHSLAVFSEIYYPGWWATIDGAEQPVLRANYILRALEVPAGNHTIEFRFEPRPYAVGNKITTAGSWATLLILLSSVGLSIRRRLKER